MKKLVLIDASYYIYRSYYGLRRTPETPWETSKGVPTNATFGFLRFILKVLRDFNPQYMVCCFDTPTSSEGRRKINPEYKNNRQKMPKDLKEQIKYIKDLCMALGVPTLDKPNLEADDLIGCLNSFFYQYGYTQIISGDKDFYQLLNSKTTIFNPSSKGKKIIEADYVKEKFGIEAYQFRDFLALVGDKSDNIKNLRGLGPKTASKLLNKFESIDNLYLNLDKIEHPKLQELLSLNKRQVLKNQKIVTIIRESKDLNISMQMIKREKPSKGAYQAILRELEFYSMLY
tara:strand:+ start:12626 stop:13486 length:861 start_codon:yes stop_codon:yes gene_type:complete